MAKDNLKTIAYQTIRQKIITCEYAPGMFLNEERLSGDLGLSRTPIRDALGRLEQEGLLSIRPKRGISISSMTTGDIHMIFEFRLLYEPYILKHYGILLTEDLLQGFYFDCLSFLSGASSFENPNHFYEADDLFHKSLVNACTNTYLVEHYARIQAKNARLRYLTSDISRERLKAAFEEHRQIIIPCLKKDWEEAADKMEYHLQESKKALLSVVFDDDAKTLFSAEPSSP